jgi:ferric-dicitrate binding protein FerR (iron transport regulator)
MNYDEFILEDFLYDEFFVRWVKNPSPESNHFWESWIKNHPDKIVTLQKAREIVHSVNYRNFHAPSDQDYTAVLEKVLKQQPSWTQNAQKDRKPRFGNWFKYAAAFCLICLFSAVILYHQNLSSEVDANPTVVILKETPFGQKLTFELSDGTLVKLNAGSRLSYSENFVGDERKVYLEGEAFFTVKRDESKPFIVETTQLTTTVLGTSFNVEAYGNEGSTVSVLSGKVQVKKSNSPIDTDTFFLTSNQLVTISSGSNSISKFDSVPPDVFSWKENIISFTKVDFNQIIDRLERWYGVDFKIQKSRPFEGLFTGRYQDEPLEIVLEGLKDEYGFQFSINDKDVLIY